MTTILDLVTKFTADVEGFKKDIGSAETTVSKLSTTLKTVAKVAAGVAVAGIMAVSGALIGSIPATINWAGKMEDAGRIMGTTAGQTAGLAVIAKETGGDIDAMATQVAYLGKNLEDAKGGLGTSGQALADLGISARDANGDVRPTIEILQDVADKLGPMPGSLAKTNLMMDLFGKSGKDVGEQMEKMANGGLSLAEEKARSFGLAVGEDASEAAGKLEVALADVKLMGQGFAVMLGTQLMPVIQPLIEDFIRWGVDAMPKVAQGIRDSIPAIERLAEDIGKTIGGVIKMIVWLDKHSSAQRGFTEAQIAAKKPVDDLAVSVKKAGGNYEDYFYQATDVLVASGRLTMALRAEVMEHVRHGDAVGTTTELYGALLDEMGLLDTAQYENMTGFEAITGGVQNYSWELYANKTALEENAGATQKAADATAEAARTQQIENDRLYAAQDAANKAATAIGEDLAGAYDDLKTAQQNWLLQVGGAATNVLAGMPGLSEAVRLAIQGTIDKLTGTTVVATNQMDADLLAAFTDYKTTLDEAALEEDILAIAGKFETELAPGIQTALDKITTLKDKLDALSDRHIKTYIDIIYNDNPPGVLNPAGGATAEERERGKKKEPPPPEYAAGGLVTQPGLYSLAEVGPELVLNADQTKAYQAGKSGERGAVHHNHYYNIAASYKYEDEKDITQGIRQLQLLEG